MPEAKVLISARSTQLTVRGGDFHIVERDEVRALDDDFYWLLSGQTPNVALAHDVFVVFVADFGFKRYVVGVLDVEAGHAVVEDL